jgi:enamine deaminase RidA (YjgF/YER057c/UK114 family)
MNERPSSIVPSGWAKPVGYAHGMSATGRVIATAGQVGWNPTSCEFESDEFLEQTAQALRNIVEVLRAAGGGPEHLVRLTWYILDKQEYMRSRKALGPKYREILGAHFPAMTVVVVSGLLEPRARLEIEATAVLPDNLSPGT